MGSEMTAQDIAAKIGEALSPQFSITTNDVVDDQVVLGIEDDDDNRFSITINATP